MISLVEMKLDEDADPLEKVGVLDTLTELLPNQKTVYSSLTTQEAFEVYTRLLVSDQAESEKQCYKLLTLIISNHEKHERFQKRINVDNFDEDLQPVNNSGSFTQNNKVASKNTDVKKDLQDSTLFSFTQVLVGNICCQAISTKLQKIKKAEE